MGLNNEYMAPRGHKYLQKGRYIIIEMNRTAANKAAFHAYNNPTIDLNAALSATIGNPASSVPAGHIKKKKNGSPWP
jgi:hypothetical protein